MSEPKWEYIEMRQEKCPACEGDGTSHREDDFGVDRYPPCKFCNGTGYHGKPVAYVKGTDLTTAELVEWYINNVAWLSTVEDNFVNRPKQFQGIDGEVIGECLRYEITRLQAELERMRQNNDRGHAIIESFESRNYELVQQVDEAVGLLDDLCHDELVNGQIVPSLGFMERMEAFLSRVGGADNER
jgi:hypothetical protein